jgi:hypothetical protein
MQARIVSTALASTTLWRFNSLCIGVCCLEGQVNVLPGEWLAVVKLEDLASDLEGS